MNVSFVSLGCDKNRVNTEQMMALCLQAGITVQEDCPGSDVVVINTCGFIDSAKSEAIDTILSAGPAEGGGADREDPGHRLPEPALSGGHSGGTAGNRRHHGHRLLRRHRAPLWSR